MNIENEIGWLFNPEHECIKELTKNNIPLVTQFYVDGIRLRHIHYSNKDEYFFTYKKGLPDGRDLELEWSIKKDEFDFITKDCNLFVRKRRFSFIDENNPLFHWDMDIILNDDDTPYMGRIEVEMPAECKEVPEVPEYIKPAIIRALDQKDRSLSNFKIALKMRDERTKGA